MTGKDFRDLVGPLIKIDDPSGAMVTDPET